MIVRLLSKKYRLFWMVIHVLLGIGSTFSNLFVIVWFYLILLSCFYLVSFSRFSKPVILAGTMVYIGAFELLARMTKCSPAIPWEASKYVFTLLTVSGLLITLGKKRTNHLGWFILLLLIPSVFIDKSGVTDTGDIIFNIMGLVNIGLGISFFSTLHLNKNRFIDMIRMMAYPCISILVFTIIKTPDLDEIGFSLGAQVATSGDFGSNQVSTVLGFGFLLLTLSWLLVWKISGSRITDGIIATIFLMQGLFTFSRGGMIGGGLALLVFMYYLYFQSSHKFSIPPSVKKYAIPSILIFIVAIIYTNNLTDGKLLLRYQGETQGTVTGTRERDLTTITSNRNLIFLSDMELWSEFPVFGSGAGTSKYMRTEVEDWLHMLNFHVFWQNMGYLELLFS